MHTFDIKEVDEKTLYIAWKMLKFHKEENHQRFYNFFHDLPNTIKADDFAEIHNMSRSALYLCHIRKILKTGLIKNLQVRIVDHSHSGIHTNPIDIQISPDMAIKRPSTYLINERGGLYTRFIAGEFDQEETLRIGGKQQDYSQYQICFLFEPEYLKLEQYIKEYLDLWGDGKFESSPDYYLSSIQIKNFTDLINEKIQNHGKVLRYTIGEYPKLNEFTLIIYFQYVLNNLTIEYHDDGVSIATIKPMSFVLQVNESLTDRKIETFRCGKLIFRIDGSYLKIANAENELRNASIKSSSIFAKMLIQANKDNTTSGIGVVEAMQRIGLSRSLLDDEKSVKDSISYFNINHGKSLSITKDDTKNIINLTKKIVTFGKFN